VVAASGPGEVTLDREALEAARRVGMNVVKALRGEAIKSTSGICPICAGNLVEFLDRGEVRCPLCGIRGNIAVEANKPIVKFKLGELARARWKPENILKHVMEEIAPTKDRYLKLLPKIKKALERYVEA
jgi:uncharacterized Zn finger protein (UPF0148 family)